MSDATGTMDELSTLKREVAELEESRKRANKIEAQEPEQKPMVEPATEKSENEIGIEGGDEHDIVGQLEKYLKEIEEAARERPALALLATFVVGVVVGQIFSRK